MAPFPVITNLCIYSGKQSPCPYSLDIFDYFQKPKLARAQLCRPTPVADIAAIGGAELMQHGNTYLLELLLKQSAERTFFQWIKEHVKEVQALFLRYHNTEKIN